MPPPATPQREGTRRALSFHWTAAIARGEEEPFRAFYQAWFGRVTALALAISRRDEAFALDIAQECMLRVARKMKPLRSEASVQAFMHRLVFTVTMDQLRAEKRRRRREEHVAMGRAEALPSHDHELLDREQMTWLRGHLAHLEPGDVSLLLARYANDRSVAALARELGLSENAAHGRVRRLLLRLSDAAREWIHE